MAQAARVTSCPRLETTYRQQPMHACHLDSHASTMLGGSTVVGLKRGLWTSFFGRSISRTPPEVESRLLSALFERPPFQSSGSPPEAQLQKSFLPDGCALDKASVCRDANPRKQFRLQASSSRVTPSPLPINGRLGSLISTETLNRLRPFHWQCNCQSATTEPALTSSVSPDAEALKLFNTMTRQKEVFRPKVEGKVGMYVCGVTAYDYSHIGHARVYVWSDCLFRLLKARGYEVTYVRNFTDVDDKIIARAKQTGEDPMALSERFCDEFREDMTSLRCLPPTSEPKVTTHIPQIVDLIQQIIDNGHAYAVAGDVYFTVDSFPEYGALSGRKQEENRAGERVAVDDRKKNPADFALWKAAKEGEPSWDSPWGRGRPGWHIECSAMSAAHLGVTFDIHGGGQDLVFPHHENELAQSRAACAAAHVGHWVHNGFVTVDEEKMSKSLGNFFTIRDVLKQFHPLALRWFLIGTQYRSPINYSRTQLDQASDRLYYLYQAAQDAHTLLADSSDADSGPPSADVAASAAALRSGFEEAMSDDLNTPKAIAAFSEPLKLMNDLLHTKKGRKNKSRVANLRLLLHEIGAAASTLGFDLAESQKILGELNSCALTRAGMSMQDLKARMEERAAARAAKDFARSDSIRAELAKVGIYLMDGGDGTLWKPGPVEDSE